MPEGMLGRLMRREDNLPETPQGLVTGRDLVVQLRRLGVMPGDTVLAHASVRSVGLAVRDASVVVDALHRAVGRMGNIVVPTGTSENSDTSRAHRNLIAEKTEAEVSAYRRNMPGFDRDHTPSTTGALGEALRTFPGAVRSAHPQSSFAAIGPNAEYLMDDHRWDCHLGEYSPLAKLYQMKASVLLIGVGYEACSAFHLAEYRYVKSPPTRMYSCVVSVNGRPEWIKYSDVVLDDGDFAEIGRSLEERKVAAVKIRNVGRAESRLIPMVRAVDYACYWMALNRL